MWPVMTFFTNSAIHTLAHGSWAQVLMLCGGAELALVRGKLQSQYWRLTTALALAVSGTSFLVHHLVGWWLIACVPFAIARAVKPRAAAWQAGFALSFVVLAVMLYSDRDRAPIFGHLSPVAGAPHR
jgi:hypothetical protein